MERLSTERLAEIRDNVLWSEADVSVEDVRDLLAEIDALTREQDEWDESFDAWQAENAHLAAELKRMEGFGPEPILYERVKAERDKLAAEKATLRAALRQIAQCDAGLEAGYRDEWRQIAERVLADTEDSPERAP